MQVPTLPFACMLRAALVLLAAACSGGSAFACGALADTPTVVQRVHGHDALARRRPLDPAIASMPAAYGPRWDQPCFGFNAKGLLNPAEQTEFARTFLAQVTPRFRHHLVLRVTGGTASQTAYASDWTDAVIAQWVRVQQRFGVHFIYVVNGNDTPANQRDIIRRWLDAGARFDFLEMMNEYYLPKYRNGDTELAEVSRQVTAEDYANVILPAFWAELDRFGLPYYLVFAPSRPARPGADQHMQAWNEVMIQQVIKRYPARNLNATLHLYTDGSNIESGFDYDQIDRLRARLPAGRHIAITEAGVIDRALDYRAEAALAIELHRKILQHLQPGDYLLDQVLYNASRHGNTASLNPNLGGITPKGWQMLDFINARLR